MVDISKLHSEKTIGLKKKSGYAYKDYSVVSCYTQEVSTTEVLE